MYTRARLVKDTPPLALKLPQRFADLFASLWGIFTQFNSRHNTITNSTIINIGRHKIIKCFVRLDTDAKNAEILRLLPLMAPFTIEFTSMQQALDTAVTRLEQVQVQRDSNLSTPVMSAETV
jgi:hypothetical protein